MGWFRVVAKGAMEDAKGFGHNNFKIKMGEAALLEAFWQASEKNSPFK